MAEGGCLFEGGPLLEHGCFFKKKTDLEVLMIIQVFREERIKYGMCYVYFDIKSLPDQFTFCLKLTGNIWGFCSIHDSC